MAKEKTLERTEPRHSPKDEVIVTEDGIRPWSGVVSTVKWSPVSGWWYDIRRDDDGLTLVINEKFLG